MKITIRSPFWSDPLELDVSPSDYIELIKEKIAEKKNKKIEEIKWQKLIFDGKPMYDELKNMSEYSVVEGSTLFLIKLKSNVYNSGGRVTS